MSISEHEKRRHTKEFVRLYLEKGPNDAGKYGLVNMCDPEKDSEEVLAFWRTAVAEEFDRRGYELVDNLDPNEVIT